MNKSIAETDNLRSRKCHKANISRNIANSTAANLDTIQIQDDYGNIHIHNNSKSCLYKSRLENKPRTVKSSDRYKQKHSSSETKHVLENIQEPIKPEKDTYETKEDLKNEYVNK